MKPINLPFSKFPIIIGEKITLREIIPKDLKDLVEISYYDAIQATTVEEAAEMQAKINQDYLNGNSIHWGIADSVTNKIVGTCGYYRGFQNESGELGCVLLPQFRGKGYMSDAMKAAIDFGLKNLELKRIWAATSPDNSAAINLLTKLNFAVTKDSADEIEFQYMKINNSH